jgi:hypothetical protein
MNGQCDNEIQLQAARFKLQAKHYNNQLQKRTKAP